MEIHRIVCGNVNCYIVAENANAILIDTGRKKYREKVLKQCRKFSVNLIVLTHGHLDHYTDEKMMRQSARQISGMGKLKIYFGHGRSVKHWA